MTDPTATLAIIEASVCNICGASGVGSTSGSPEYRCTTCQSIRIPINPWYTVVLKYIRSIMGD